MRGFGGTTMMVAALVFGISAVVFGATVVDAVWIDPAVDPPPESGGAGEAVETVAASEEPATPGDPDPGAAQDPRPDPRPPQGMVYPKVTRTEILGAVNQDLFQPDRTPPLMPYLLPSERPVLRQSSRNNGRQRQPELRLVGTAITGDMAFALIQTEDSLPVVFMLGETVEGYTLTTVTEGNITLSRDETEFNYPVMETYRGGSSNSRDRNANSRSRNTSATEEQAALQLRLRAAIQAMQQESRAVVPLRARGGGGGGGSGGVR